MVLPVAVRQKGSLIDDFFNDYVKRTIQLNSKNSTAITILPLPEATRPKDFSLGVGHFQVSASAGPTDVQQGDPVTLKMIVSGTGNLQSITAPTLINSTGFKVYDPQRKDSGARTSGGGNEDNTGRVTFEQVLIPIDAKVKQIGPITFSYFDPDSGSYRQVTAAAIPINVKPNPNFNATAVMSSVSSNTGNEELGQDLIYIKDNPGRLDAGHKPLYRSFWFELLQLLPLLGLLAAFIYRKQQKLLQADTPQSRALRANSQANRRLATANALRISGKYEELLDELHVTIRQYLGEKFNLAAAGMTVKVVESLTAKGIPTAITEDIREFFERYDYHRFTGAALGQNDAGEFWERALRIINALDHRKKKLINSKPETFVSGGDVNGK